MQYEMIYQAGLKKLQDAGIQEWQSDGWILFSESFGLSRSAYFLKKQEEIPVTQSDRLERYFERLNRRIAHEPVQYIIGNQEFFGLTFQVNPNVLIPRLDTEVLVEEILKENTEGKKVLDLCTGSGCILISLLKCGKFSEGVGTDLSEEALKVAALNAADNGVSVKFVQGDLFEALERAGEEIPLTYDIIVSNPPYIDPQEVEELEPEVIDHEPCMALFADNHGLSFYEKILEKADKYLNPKGMIFFEIGYNQGKAVKKMCEERGFTNVMIIKDLAGLDRVVKGYRDL